MKIETRNTLLLILCAFIWGMAFVAQSAGAALGPYTFLACRSWLAVLVLTPTVKVFDAVRRRRGEPEGKPRDAAARGLLARGGLACGTLLFFASASQQIGITLDPSTAKAGFITAMYVVLVPVISVLLGRRNGAQLWVCVALSVLGLYLLCMRGGFGAVQRSDWFLMACALLFALQIMAVDRYSPHMDGVRLSLAQFLVVSVWSTAASLLLEGPSLAAIGQNALPVLYCGVMSSGVAYTLQIIGQRQLNPAVASLAMSLESVFSALGGWLLLQQALSVRELSGCVLIFAAVVLAQLPVNDWLRAAKRGAST